MTKQDKRFEAIRLNPKNVRPADMDAVLTASGFLSRQRGTSHKVYWRGVQRLTIPQQKPFLKIVCVLLALELLEAGDVQADTDTTEDD